MLVKGLSISLDAGAFTSHLSGCMPSGYVEACLHVSQHPYMGSRVVSPAQGLIGFLRRICLSYSPSVCLSSSTGVSSATHWTYTSASFHCPRFYLGQETFLPLVLSCLVSVAASLMSVARNILQSVCSCSKGCELRHSGLLPLFLLSSLPFF